MDKNNNAWLQAFSTETNATKPMFYVTEDGNYGSDHALLVPFALLSEEQLDIVGDLHDSQRLDYIKAILNNNEQEFLDELGY